MRMIGIGGLGLALCSVAAPPLGGRVVFPALAVGIPKAFGEQAIDVRQRAVAANKEPKPLAILFPGPFARPWFAARIIGIEAVTAKRLPATMHAALNIAA